MRRSVVFSVFAIIVVSSCAGEAETTASLLQRSEHGTYQIEAGPMEAGYPVRFRCVENCPRPVNFLATGGDHPLGLFSRDQDDLVFYLSAGGVAYQVRAWQITDTGVKRVLETYSRARPDFLSDSDGHAVVQTYEGQTNMGPLTLVRWTYRDGAFVRTPPDGP